MLNGLRVMAALLFLRDKVVRPISWPRLNRSDPTEEPRTPRPSIGTMRPCGWRCRKSLTNWGSRPDDPQFFVDFLA